MDRNPVEGVLSLTGLGSLRSAVPRASAARGEAVLNGNPYDVCKAATSDNKGCDIVMVRSDCTWVRSGLGVLVRGCVCGASAAGSMALAGGVLAPTRVAMGSMRPEADRLAACKAPGLAGIEDADDWRTTVCVGCGCGCWCCGGEALLMTCCGDTGARIGDCGADGEGWKRSCCGACGDGRRTVGGGSRRALLAGSVGGDTGLNTIVPGDPQRPRTNASGDLTACECPLARRKSEAERGLCLRNTLPFPVPRAQPLSLDATKDGESASTPPCRPRAVPKAKGGCTACCTGEAFRSCLEEGLRKCAASAGAAPEPDATAVEDDEGTSLASAGTVCDACAGDGGATRAVWPPLTSDPEPLTTGAGLGGITMTRCVGGPWGRSSCCGCGWSDGVAGVAKAGVGNAEDEEEATPAGASFGAKSASPGKDGGG